MARPLRIELVRYILRSGGELENFSPYLESMELQQLSRQYRFNLPEFAEEEGSADRVNPTISTPSVI